MSAAAFTYALERGALHTLTARKVALTTKTEQDRLFGRYRLLTESQEELRRDASSAIGLFEQKSEIGPLDSIRLERCLADLLMLLIQPELSVKGNVILIQGPSFPKLVGRLGYRYPRRDLTIAFVTTDQRLSRDGASVPGSAKLEWEGPFPGYEEEQIVRTFFHRSAGVRVDLFAQGLGRYPVDYIAEGCALGVRSKLNDSANEFLAFSEYLAELRTVVQPSLPLRDASEPDKKLAARKDLQKPASLDMPSQDGEDEGHRAGVVNKSVPSGLEEALYRGVSTVAVDTVTWQQRFKKLKQFFDEDQLGTFMDNFAFIEYVEERAKKQKTPRTFVYTIGDLQRWYREFGDRLF